MFFHISQNFYKRLFYRKNVAHLDIYALLRAESWVWIQAGVIFFLAWFFSNLKENHDRFSQNNHMIPNPNSFPGDFLEKICDGLFLENSQPFFVKMSQLRFKPTAYALRPYTSSCKNFKKKKSNWMSSLTYIPSEILDKEETSNRSEYLVICPPLEMINSFHKLQRNE